MTFSPELAIVIEQRLTQFFQLLFCLCKNRQESCLNPSVEFQFYHLALRFLKKAASNGSTGLSFGKWDNNNCFLYILSELNYFIPKPIILTKESQ